MTKPDANQVWQSCFWVGKHSLVSATMFFWGVVVQEEGHLLILFYGREKQGSLVKG